MIATNKVINEFLTSQKPETILNHLRIQGFEKLAQYLESTDFFVAPGSTIHHDATKGGLAYHSILTAFYLLKLVSNSKLQSGSFKSVAEKCLILGLTHDLCKINLFEISYRNTKDERGNWIKVPYFSSRKDYVSDGHGLESAVRASKVLNTEQADEVFHPILYHMGTFETTEYSKRSLQQRAIRNPWVRLLHFADLLAADQSDAVTSGVRYDLY